MPVWPALILAPLLALAHVAIGHAMTTPSCAAQADWALRMLSPGLGGVTLLLTGMTAAEARRRRAQAVQAVQAPGAAASSLPPFIARVASWNGALSTLVIAAQGIAPWVLLPCAA